MSGTRGLSAARVDSRERGGTEPCGFYNYALLDGIQNMGDQAKHGPAYYIVGDHHYNLGEFEEALRYHKNYFKIVEKENDRAGMGRAYGKLGKDYHSLGKFQKAIICHLRQQNIAIEIGDKAEEGRACENLGSTYFSMDYFKSSTEYYKTALRIAEEIGDEAKIARANSNLSKSCCHAGAYEDAIRYHLNDLSIVRSLEDNVGEGVAHGNLGSIYFSQGLFEKAIECQKLNLDIAKEVGNSVEEGKAGYELGCSFESLGKLDEALNCFRSSLKQFDEIRSRSQSNNNCKINLQNEYSIVNIAICRVLLKQRHFFQALSAVENGRAPMLMERLKSTYGPETSQSGLTSQEDKLTNMLSHLSSTTVYLAIDKTELYIWVLRKGGELYFEESKFIKRFEKEGIMSFSSLIRDAYPLTEEELLSLKATSAYGADELRRQRAELMEKSFRILYDVVIKPVAHLLEGNELIIVPDGPLCVAPFAAFIGPDSKYLSESYTIRVIPSLTSLKLIVDSSQYHSRRGALLVGNPCLEEISFDPSWNWQLPGAEKEVRFIGDMLNTTPVTLLTGKEATNEEVFKHLKSTPYSLVHIAAKGSPENGEFYFAPNPTRESEEPEEEDYMFTMEHVMSLKLRAQLAALGCCHSIQGQIKAEGAVGIGWAFMAAGTRCVLVSLWEINDEATCEFMKTFYQCLVFGKVKASVALNQAIKKLRESKKFSGVEYWAAFQLIGDDVTLDFEEHD